MDHYLKEAIGPREVGGRYFNGHWGKEYIVVALEIDVPGWMPWAITCDWEDGRKTTHCTPWDPRRDKVLEQPGVAVKEI